MELHDTDVILELKQMLLYTGVAVLLCIICCQIVFCKTLIISCWKKYKVKMAIRKRQAEEYEMTSGGSLESGPLNPDIISGRPGRVTPPLMPDDVVEVQEDGGDKKMEKRRSSADDGAVTTSTRDRPVTRSQSGTPKKLKKLQ